MVFTTRPLKRSTTPLTSDRNAFTTPAAALSPSVLYSLVLSLMSANNTARFWVSRAICHVVVQTPVIIPHAGVAYANSCAVVLLQSQMYPVGCRERFDVA